MSIDRILSEQRANKKLVRELSDLIKLHTGLKINYRDERPISLSGNYDVRDNQGILQDTFSIEILFPLRYPFGFPVLREVEGKIKREDEYHVDENGYACVEILPVVNLVARTGITIGKFIEKYVHRFLCWQILYRYDKTISYWDHKEDGILQFYREALGITDLGTIKHLLESMIKNMLPQRNELCPCNSNYKYKNCHWAKIEYLKQFGNNDLKYALSIINNSSN